MFVHKNSQLQANTPPALARSDYVKPRQNDSKESPPVSIGEGVSEQNISNSDDVCFTSYSSFTVKPKSIKPMDLRSLQSYSIPSTPEKKLFSNLNVSTLVSPVTSLFNSEKKAEGSRPLEVDTIRGPRYDAMGIHGDRSTKKENEIGPTTKKPVNFPKPSLDAILAGIHQPHNERDHEQTCETDDGQDELLMSALSATEQFHILSLNEYKLLQQDYLEHAISIDTLKSKLEQELKFREGASSMVSVQTDKKLLEQAQEELASSERKVNQFSSELWRMSQSANLLEKRCLEHVAAVLARSIREGTGAFKITTSTSCQEDADHSPSETAPEISISDLSHMCTQLNEMSNKLSAFVNSQTSLTERDNVALRESLSQALLEKERYKRELEELKKKRAEGHISSQDLPALSEEEKDQMIYRLRQTVDECLLDISQLNDEKEEMLSNLKCIYLRLPDPSLSRESSISSKTSENCEFDGKKFTDRIGRLIQENHRLMERVVKLQHKNQYAKVDRRGAISPKDRYQGVYSNKSNLNSNSRIWLEESSSDEESSLNIEENTMNSLGASLQNRTL